MISDGASNNLDEKAGKYTDKYDNFIWDLDRLRGKGTPEWGGK